MRETGAHVSQSLHHLLLEWLARWLEFREGELVKAVLREVITSEDIEELVSYPRLAIQIFDVKIVEMGHAEGSLNLVFDFVNNPRNLL